MQNFLTADINIRPQSNTFPVSDLIGHSKLINTVNFHHFIQEKFLSRTGLLNDLAEDLKKDDLDMCYQPIIDLTSGETVCAEALIRWQHKLTGFISPEIFIPLAEQSGHIHALTYWVINHSLKQMTIIGSINQSLQMAVNVSMFNLHEKTFPKQVSRLLDKWSIHPSRLVIEITEGVIMHDPEKVITVLNKLDAIGVQLALDDFGTGYSSLSYLAKLPISKLKIDRSLIQDIDINQKNSTIVESTIYMAKRLGMNVVAEGVETKNIYEKLESFGCDQIQGYYFSKPLNDEDFTKWFQ